MDAIDIYNALFALGLSIAILYASAGAWFLFFRFARPESGATMRRFLEVHYRFFTERVVGTPRPEVTRQAIREAGERGWSAIILPVIGLGFGVTYLGLLACSPVLLLGGMWFAYSWYGFRCLRLLKLESYAKPSA